MKRSSLAILKRNLQQTKKIVHLRDYSKGERGPPKLVRMIAPPKQTSF